MKFKSALRIITVLLLGLFSLGNVSAATSHDYVIDSVEVESRTVSENDVNFITFERGDSLDVEIWVKGMQSSVGTVRDDVKVKAWIGGYEYGDVAE